MTITMRFLTRQRLVSLYLVFFIVQVQCEHIVFLHNCVSYSHRVASFGLIKELLNKGHHVTHIGGFGNHATDPFHHANFTDMLPKTLNHFLEGVIAGNFDVTHRAYGLTPKFVMVYDYICVTSCDVLFRSEEFKQWMRKSPKVDLVFSDSMTDCGYGLAAKLKAKQGLILPVSIVNRYVDALGLTAESATIPDWDVSYKPPLSFWQRAVGVMIPLLWRIQQILIYEFKYKSIFRDYLALNPVPELYEMQRNLSLVLINGDFIEDYPRSLPPMVVKLPGLHVKSANGLKNGPVDKEIETFILSKTEKGKENEGFFYISFGTVAKGPNLPLEIRRAFFSAMEKFPNLKFIWSWDGPMPDKIPKNLLLKKWVRQENLLGHPRIRGFITQAGRPSMQESFFNGVPTISIPILADQDFNSHRYEQLGASINLELVGISEEAIVEAIQSLTNSSKFPERTKELARFTKDRQVNPIESAVWWTEFILRNSQDNLNLLKPPNQSVYWFQKRELDVWAFFTVLFYMSFKIFFWITAKVFRRVVGGPSKKQKTS